MRRILLSLAIVAMVATSAQATAFVWWQMDAGPAGATATGGNGQTLNISGAAGDYSLSMWIATDAALATQGTTCYRNNIWRGADAGLTMNGDPMTGLLDPLGWTGTAGYTSGSQNSGDALILNWGKARSGTQTPISAANSPIKVIVMSLTVGAGAHDVYQTVGASLFAWNPPIPTTLNLVKFGPNANVAGGTSVNNMPTGLQPVIHFVPEPTTLALLGLGLLGLIRRR